MSPLVLRDLIKIGEKVVQKKLSEKPGPYKDFLESGTNVEEVAEKAWKYIQNRIIEIVVTGERNSYSFFSGRLCAVGEADVKWMDVILQNHNCREKLIQIIYLHLRDEGLVCKLEVDILNYLEIRDIVYIN